MCASTREWTFLAPDVILRLRQLSSGAVGPVLVLPFNLFCLFPLPLSCLFSWSHQEMVQSLVSYLRKEICLEREANGIMLVQTVKCTVLAYGLPFQAFPSSFIPPWTPSSLGGYRRPGRGLGTGSRAEPAEAVGWALEPLHFWVPWGLLWCLPQDGCIPFDCGLQPFSCPSPLTCLSRCHVGVCFFLVASKAVCLHR